MMQSSFQIHLVSGKLLSNSQKAISLSNSKKLGEIVNKQVIFSPFETLYLTESRKVQILKNNKQISENQLIKLFSKKDKDFFIKYIIFKELRKKGYIVKTGLKFGAEFRVYEKKSQHAKWIVFPIKQSENINLREFISLNRITHSTAKKLLIAIIDSEESVSFYETDWIKP